MLHNRRLYYHFQKSVLFQHLDQGGDAGDRMLDLIEGDAQPLMAEPLQQLGHDRANGRVPPWPRRGSREEPRRNRPVEAERRSSRSTGRRARRRTSSTRRAASTAPSRARRGRSLCAGCSGGFASGAGCGRGDAHRHP